MYSPYWRLTFPLVWAIVLSIPAVMRRPECGIKQYSSHTFFVLSAFIWELEGTTINNMLNRLLTSSLNSLSTYGIANSHSQLRELYQYTCSHLSQLDKVNDYYMAGAIFSIISYEKLGLRQEEILDTYDVLSF